MDCAGVVVNVVACCDMSSARFFAGDLGVSFSADVGPLSCAPIVVDFVVVVVVSLCCVTCCVDRGAAIAIDVCLVRCATAFGGFVDVDVASLDRAICCGVRSLCNSCWCWCCVLCCVDRGATIAIDIVVLSRCATAIGDFVDVDVASLDRAICCSARCW